MHTKKSVGASHWLVALRTFYRQILSLAYSVFPPETSAPGLPGFTCNLGCTEESLCTNEYSKIAIVCSLVSPHFQSILKCEANGGKSSFVLIGCRGSNNSLRVADSAYQSTPERATERQ